MATYVVAAGCGHTSTIELYGPTIERDRRIGWMESESGKCNACYTASKRTEEAAGLTSAIAALAAKITAQYSGPPPVEIVAKLRSQAAEHAGEQRTAIMLGALDLLGV